MSASPGDDGCGAERPGGAHQDGRRSMPGPTRRQLLTGLGAAAGLPLLGSLAGCGLPGSSEVLPGRPVDQNVAPNVQIVAPRPMPGATPEAIARGFIQAGVTFQDNDDTPDSVGRAYLTADSVARWHPTSAVTVFDTGSFPTWQDLGQGRLLGTVTAVATIDELGRYAEPAPGATSTVTFTMVQVDGQWRVSLPPNGFGLWLSTDDFGRLFQACQIAYVVPGTKQLTYDVRWFASGQRLASALARAQLGAVPDYLRGAVTTGFPDGTRLAVDSVSVESAVATVTLTAEAGQVDTDGRRAMWAQMTATLTQSGTGIASTALAVQGGGPLRLAGIDGPAASAGQLGYATRQPSVPVTTCVLDAGGLSAVDVAALEDPSRRGRSGAQTTGTKSGDLPPVPVGIDGLAMSPDGRDVAGLSYDHGILLRWRDGAQVKVADVGTTLTRPSYDHRGRLWFGGQLADLPPERSVVATMDATTTSAGVAGVAAAWLAGRIVDFVVPSPDATRVAVVSHVAGGGDQQLSLAGVVRDPVSGLPVSLGSPLRQGHALSGMLDLVWLDDLSLVVLGRVAPKIDLRPFVVDLGQGVGLRRVGNLDPVQTLIAPVSQARWVTSWGGREGLAVTTSARAVLTRVGSGWVTYPSITGVLVSGT